jgi:hypothetical protein
VYKENKRRNYTPRSLTLTPANGRKLFTSQSVVRTRRYCKRVKLLKRQKSFQGIAMYGHEVLMSYNKTRAKFFGTYREVRCMTTDFNMVT